MWYSFYGDTYDGNSYKNCKNCQVLPKNNEIYVYESSFIDKSSGAISISTDDIKFLHTYCFFYNCHNTDNGGAIYYNGNGAIIQHRFCTINSYITGGVGLHSYTKLVENSQKQNHIIECSISNCIGEEGNHLIFFQNGNCGISSSNISRNTVYRCPGFVVSSPTGDCVFNYSTFEKNTANGWVCQEFDPTTTAKYHELFCNIVDNTEKSSTWGIITTFAELIIENCTILGPPENGVTIYIASRGKLTIKNCNVDKYYSVYGTNNAFNIITTDELNPLSHLSTQKCDAVIQLQDKIKYSIEKTATDLPTIYVAQYILMLTNQLFLPC